MEALEKITKEETNEHFLNGLKEDIKCWALTSGYSGIFLIVGLTGPGENLNYDLLGGITVRTAILGLSGAWGITSGIGWRRTWKDLKEYIANPGEYVQKYYRKSLE